MIRCFLLLLGLLAANAAAAEPGIRVEAAWARATPAGATVGAVYLTIVDSGVAADRLVALATPAARQAGLHIDLSDGAVMQMRPVSVLDVKPGQRIVLKPGGLHIMLVGLVRPLSAGAHLTLSLTFERAGRIDADVLVRPPGAHGPS